MTSSRKASASCLDCSSRETSARGKDQFNMVTGPVSIPFMGFLVTLCAYELHLTVIGLGRLTSETMIGGRTYL